MMVTGSAELLAADRWYAVLNGARRRCGVLAGQDRSRWAFDLTRADDYARFVDGPEKRRYLSAVGRARQELLVSLAEALDSADDAAIEGLYLKADDLKELVRAGWAIGSHTISHPLLPALDVSAADRELRGSRERLATLGIAPRTFAYPDGAWNQATAERVRACGYEAAVTLEASLVSPAHSQHSLPRVLPKDDRDWVEHALLSRA